MRGSLLRVAAAVAALSVPLAGLAVAKPLARTSKHRHVSVVSTPTLSAAPNTLTTSTTPATATTPTATTAAKPTKPAKKPAPPQPLSGLLGGGSLFPARTLILSAPSASQLDPTQVHVNENGAPVGGLSVTHLINAGPNDFGVVLVIDQSTSMTGTPMAQALAAGRALAAERRGNQQLGVITFGQTPRVLLPLTTNQTNIDNVLSVTPAGTPGERPQPALSLAVKLLRQAKIAAGSVILIADGAQLQGDPGAVARQGLSSGIQMFTFGLKDQSYDATASANLRALGTTLTEADGAKLNSPVARTFLELSHDYVVRYQSNAPRGRAVTVSAQVDGAPGTVNLSYLAPAPPKRVVPVHRAAPKPAPAPALVLPTVPAHASHSFWSSGLALVLVGVVSALLLAIAAALVVSSSFSGGKLQKRVATFIPAAEHGEAAEVTTSERERAVPKLLAARERWPAFVEQVEVAQLERAPTDLVKRSAWGSVLAAVILMVVSGSLLLAIVGLAVGPVLLRLYVNRAAKKQRRRFTDQLPTHLQDLAGAMRSGRSIVGGMAAVAESAAEPLGGEFDRVLADERLGKPLEEALQAMAKRMGSDDVDQFALIAALNRRSGSNVAEALDRVAEGARERADLGRELKALTSQAKISSRVLTALPALMLAAIELLDPGYAKPLFDTTLGIVVLCLCVVMVTCGWLVMRKIVDVEA